MRSLRRASIASSPSRRRGQSQHFTQDIEADLFLDAILRRVEIDELRHIDHAVGEDDDLAAVHVDHGAADAAAGDLVRLGAVDRLAVHSDDLTGHGIGHGLGQRLAVQTAPDVHFFIELYSGQPWKRHSAAHRRTAPRDNSRNFRLWAALPDAGGGKFQAEIPHASCTGPCPWSP